MYCLGLTAWHLEVRKTFFLNEIIHLQQSPCLLVMIDFLNLAVDMLRSLETTSTFRLKCY